jgi:hypothetical protein
MTGPAATFKPEVPLVRTAFVALMGWLLPGLGYWVTGRRKRGLYAGIAILSLFLGSLLVAGIRTITVPGYNHRGEYSSITGPGGSLNPIRAIMAGPYFYGQIFVGPTTIVGGYLSVQAAEAGVMRASPKTDAVASLASAVAGILNLLVIIDACARDRRTGGDRVDEEAT